LELEEMSELFPLVRSGESQHIRGVVSPESALVDYDQLRRSFPSLPTSLAEGEQLKATYKAYALELSIGVAASSPLELVGVHNILSALAAAGTASTTRINVRLNSVANDPIPLVAGVSINGMLFERLFVDWSAQAGESLTLLGIFDPRGDRTQIG
jgi:hypothetical protein